MKIGTLYKLFDELQNFLRARQDFAAASLIQGLRGLFKGFDNATLTVFAKKVDKWKTANEQGRTSPALQNLQVLLGECGTLLQVSGAKAAAADLRIVATFFDGCTHSSVTAFVASAQDLLSENKSTKARSSKSTASDRAATSELRIDLVRTYADQLTAAHEDNDAFHEVAARLEADRRVRVQEMLAIGNRYCGYDLGRRTRRKALQGIRDIQTLDARHAIKKVAHHMTSW